MKTNSIVEYMSAEAVKSNIQDTIGNKTPQFVASVASLVNSNPKIAECEQKSILSACLIASSLDLPINQNLGFAYIIPYKTKASAKVINDQGKEITVQRSVMVAQFQMGYKGFIQLAQRSGQFKTINVTDVREGEIKGNNRLTGEIDFSWLDEDRDKSPIIGYVAYMELNTGFSKQLYMSTDELKKHGMRFSQTMKQGFGLWTEDFGSMASKTVIKMLLSKYAPMTIEMQRAHEADQAVVGETLEYPDNKPVDPAQMAEEKETARILEHIEQSKTVEELKQCEEALEEQNQDVADLFNRKLEELKNATN